jgi:hypothetical protein
MLFLRDMIIGVLLEIAFLQSPYEHLITVLSGSPVKTVVELTILLLGWGWADKSGNPMVACHVM